MQKLRAIHLYLGCVFAPMLLFFAVSGIWQTLGIHHRNDSKTLMLMSTLHHGRGLKSNENLSSPLMHYFIVAMAAAFIITTLLGIMMAFKFGRSRKAALLCLVAGVLVPLVLVGIRVWA